LGHTCAKKKSCVMFQKLIIMGILCVPGHLPLVCRSLAAGHLSEAREAETHGVQESPRSLVTPYAQGAFNRKALGWAPGGKGILGNLSPTLSSACGGSQCEAMVSGHIFCLGRHGSTTCWPEPSSSRQPHRVQLKRSEVRSAEAWGEQAVFLPGTDNCQTWGL
jgi:hypothetical protein